MSLNINPFSFLNTSQSEDMKRSILEIHTFLHQIIEKWFRDFAAANAMFVPPPPAWFRLELFGSAALGTVARDSDVDCILLVPAHTTKDDICAELPKLLDKKCSDIQVIARATVPLITFRRNGMTVDLCFAPIAKMTAPTDEDLLSDEILDLCQGNLWRSLQGIRVALFFKRSCLCLDPTYAHFIDTVRVVKTWAIGKHIYGNNFCFPGGITWTLLVADAILKSDRASRTSLKDCVIVFFQYLVDLIEKQQQRWSPVPPVSLTIAQGKISATHGLPEYVVTQWSKPKYKGWNAIEDGNDFFPVLNPVFPFMNSSYNVTMSSVAVIKQEALRVYTHLCLDKEKDWDALLIPVDWLTMAPSFIVLETRTTNQSYHAFERWMSLFESKIKMFLYSIEAIYPNISFRFVPERFADKPHNTGRRRHKSAELPVFVGRYLLATTAAPGEITLTKALQDLTYSLGAIVDDTSAPLVRHFTPEEIQHVLFDGYSRKQLGDDDSTPSAKRIRRQK
eukprot:PhF_6_TR41088/c0_g1_i1/m.62244/K14376/PAP; poly(A) polymerase